MTAPTACRARRRERAQRRPRCKCRPTSTCSCATAACCTSMPRAASRGTFRTSRQPAARRRRVDARGAARARRAKFAGRIEVTAQAVRRRRASRCRREVHGRLAAVGRSSTTSTWPSRRGCSRRRPSCRRPAAATWPSGSSGEAGALASGTVGARARRRGAAELRSAPSTRASSASRCRATGSARATRGTLRCATSPSRAAAALGRRRRPSISTSARDADGIDALRAAQQLPAARGPDAVLRAAAGVAPARVVVRAGAARRPARRRPRADAHRRRAASTTRVSADFAGLGIETFEGLPGITGLTGQVRADSRTRTARARERAAPTLDWPALFRGVLDVPELRGIVVWRAGQDAVRVVSDDLLVVTPDASLRTNLELTLPMDDSSPELDLRTSSVGASTSPRCRSYLPAHKMPPTVVAWLDSALRGGRATSAEVTFVGPVRAFPFDGGEGEFRATVARRGRAARVRQRLAARRGSRRHRRVRQRAVRGARQRPRARQPNGRRARRHRRSARRRLRAAGRYDRRARSSARVLERLRR